MILQTNLKLLYNLWFKNWIVQVNWTVPIYFIVGSGLDLRALLALYSHVLVLSVMLALLLGLIACIFKYKRCVIKF